MTKTTTNLVGILITILAGTYFFVSYCSECRVEQTEPTVMEEHILPAKEPLASINGPEVPLADNNADDGETQSRSAAQATNE